MWFHPSSILLLGWSLLSMGQATNSTNSTTKFKSTIVYSFANVTSTPEGNHVAQLTIATGSDGQFHYVRSENGQRQEGIWSGPLPQTPKVDLDLEMGGITRVGNSAPYSSSNHSNPGLSKMSEEIDLSIKGYLSAALGGGF